jgi:hypothetical protein
MKLIKKEIIQELSPEKNLPKVIGAWITLRETKGRKGSDDYLSIYVITQFLI